MSAGFVAVFVSFALFGFFTHPPPFFWVLLMNLHAWLSKQEVSPLQWKVAMQVHYHTEQHTAASATVGRREVSLKVVMNVLVEEKEKA